MAAVDYALVVLYALTAVSLLRVAVRESKTAYRVGLAIGAISMSLAIVWELVDGGPVSLPPSVTEGLFWVTGLAFVVGAIAGLAYLADKGLDPDS